MRRLPLRSPPRMRGKVAGLCGHAGGHGITPACAGKRGRPHSGPGTTRDHPRVCGEKKKLSPNFTVYEGSPPRVRGKGYTGSAARPAGRITPACAGKSYSPPQGSKRQGDHPRVCGEKSGRVRPWRKHKGSPPRVRGKGVRSTCIPALTRITPACAGKSKTRRVQWPVGLDHPRVCGEKRPDRQLTGWPLGSPPRVRGKVDCSAQLWPLYGITPAYAGKSPDAACFSVTGSGSPPRMRGKESSGNHLLSG